MFSRVGEASLAELELVEAARLVTVVPLLRSPLRARVERRHVLANMIGKLAYNLARAAIE
jgi:hypothetical protein